MRYIEYISNSKYGRFGFNHSVVSNGKQVLSYEMKKPLGEGEFKLYDIKEWDKIEKEITYTKEIKYFNLSKYKGKKLNGLSCFEALNTIAPMPIKQRVKTIMRWLLIALIYGVLCFLFGYYGFTMSEEEFLQYKTEICQE